MQQYPRIPHGLKLDRDGVSVRRPRLRIQPVRQAAAAVQADEVGGWETQRTVSARWESASLKPSSGPVSPSDRIFGCRVLNCCTAPTPTFGPSCQFSRGRVCTVVIKPCLDGGQIAFLFICIDLIWLRAPVFTGSAVLFGSRPGISFCYLSKHIMKCCVASPR